MTRAELLLLLPIAWAIVATIIGLVLYRSSRALFRSGDASTRRGKTIRLTGSAAIAAIAFLGIRQATSKEMIEAAARGERSIPIQQLQALAEHARDVESKTMEIGGCAEMAGSLAACEETVTGARLAASKLRESAERLGASPSGGQKR